MQKGRKSHPTHILKLFRTTTACGLKGHPTPTHASVGSKPTFLQGPSPCPTPGNRFETAGGKLCPHFFPVSQNRKEMKNKRNFSTNYSHLIYYKSLCPPQIVYIPTQTCPKARPSPPFTTWTQFKSYTRIFSGESFT